MQQRLFEITLLLTQHGKVTAGELAERFGVSRRTIYRDIDALSAAGIPVYAEKGKGGGICLLPDFVLDKTLFSKKEQSQLLSHFQSLSSIGTPDTQMVHDKLAAVFGGGHSWLEVDFAPWDGGEETRQLFRLLRDSILANHEVQFRYHSSSGAENIRQVEPYRIVFRGQGWYLYGFSLERNDFRFFKLSRMAGFTATDEIFLPRTIPERTGDVPYGGKMITLILRIYSSAAFRVYDEFSKGQIKRQVDGSFLVKATFPEDDWLYGYILSYGPQAEVLAPATFRRQIAKYLKETAKRYSAL